MSIPDSVHVQYELGISHNESIYTMAFGRCRKLGFPTPPESWLLNTYQPSSITACSEEVSIPVAIVTVTDGQATEMK